MKLLLHTMATPKLSPTGALELAKKLGYDGVDLVSQANYGCALDPSASLEDARAIAAEAKKIGVPIRALTPYDKAINVADKEVRAKAMAGFRRAIEHAAAIGADKIRVLPGVDVPDDKWDATLDLLVESLRSLADLGAKAGVAINIENHDGTMGDTAERTMRIWRAANHSNVGIIYDPANLIRDKKEDYPENFTIQAEGIRHIHLKDYIFRADYPNGRRAVVPGEGVIPWVGIFRDLHKIGFTGDLSLEYETRWVPEQLPAPEIGLAQACTYLRKCIAETAKS
jgi:L-ribulose-5-phosphate 3-epimerase